MTINLEKARLEFEDGKGRPLNGSQTFYSLLGRAADVHDSKSHDYASNSDPLGNYRFAGELSRLFSDPTDAGLIGRFGEKLYRLANLDKKGSEPKNESVEDTEIDMLVIIGLFAANRRDRRNQTKVKDDFAFTCANCMNTFNRTRPSIILTNTVKEGLRQYYLCSDKCEKELREKL